jgi:hypothetical protein
MTTSNLMTRVFLSNGVRSFKYITSWILDGGMALAMEREDGNVLVPAIIALTHYVSHC